MSGQIQNGPAFLVTGIVQNDMYGLSCISLGYFAQHLADLCRCDIAVIGYCQNLFCGIIHGTKDIVALSPGKSQDKPACCSINTDQKITAHYKMGSIQKQQDQLGLFRLLHQRLSCFFIKHTLFFWIGFGRKRTAFPLFDAVFFNSLPTAVTETET